MGGDFEEGRGEGEGQSSFRRNATLSGAIELRSESDRDLRRETSGLRGYFVGVENRNIEEREMDAAPLAQRPASLERENRQLRSKLERLLRRLEHADAMYDAVQQDKEDAVSALEVRLKVEASIAQNLRDELRKLRAKIPLNSTASVTTKSDDLEREFKREVLNLQRENAQLREQLKNKTTKGPSTESELPTLTEKLRDLEEQLAFSVERERSAIEAAAGGGNKKAAQREELLRDTTEALYEWKEECELIQNQMHDYEQEIASLTEKLDKAVRQSSKEASRASNLEGDLAKALTEIENLKKGNKESWERMQKEYASDLAERKRENEELVDKVCKLEEDLNEHKVLFRSTSSEKAEALKQLQLVRDVSKSLRQGYKICEESRAQLLDELNEVQQETSAMAEWSRNVMRTISKI